MIASSIQRNECSIKRLAIMEFHLTNEKSTKNIQMKLKLFITSLSVVLSAAVLSACSSSKKTTSDTVKKTEEIPEHKYTAAELQEGKMLWESHCDRCHKLYLPESRTKEKWDRILPRMVKRSKLDAEKAGKVRGYIMSLAKN